MSYYLAPSLVTLRNEINAAHKTRDKSSDGWIGDASHAARVSDHNPDYSAGGVVRAIDVDKDGINVDELLKVLFHDARVEYVIWNGGIYTRQNGFRRAAYTGPNKHTGHIHVSLRHTKEAENPRPWGYNGAASPSPATPSRLTVTQVAREVIAGHYGNEPQRSARLQAAGYNPAQVQAEVNRLMGAPAAKLPTRLSVSLLATQVIAGQWGNGPTRAQRLTAAGYDAAAVQAEVNRRLLRR